MKKMISLILSLAAACLYALPVRAADGSHSASEQMFRQLEEQWMTAVKQGDVKAQAAFETPDWTIILASGELLTKGQAAQTLKSGDYKLESFKLDGLSVRMLGKTAVVQGLETEKSQYKGQDTSGQYRFTDVFVKRDGRWLVSVSQMTGVVKE